MNKNKAREARTAIHVREFREPYGALRTISVSSKLFE
jgi:hypothetical protein